MAKNHLDFENDMIKYGFKIVSAQQNFNSAMLALQVFFKTFDQQFLKVTYLEFLPP